jgi:predicted HicB family RNase H-like nuclease
LSTIDFKKYICYYDRGGEKMKKEQRKVFTFRVPESLHLRMEMAANEESRTLNSWLLNVVKQYLKEQDEKK